MKRTEDSICDGIVPICSGLDVANSVHTGTWSEPLNSGRMSQPEKEAINCASCNKVQHNTPSIGMGMPGYLSDCNN